MAVRKRPPVGQGRNGSSLRRRAQALLPLGGLGSVAFARLGLVPGGVQGREAARPLARFDVLVAAILRKDALRLEQVSFGELEFGWALRYPQACLAEQTFQGRI